jgi:hypothetical protein
MILSRDQTLMIRKPIELPPAVAHAFVKDMKALLAEEYKKAPDNVGAFAFGRTVPRPGMAGDFLTRRRLCAWLGLVGIF